MIKIISVVIMAGALVHCGPVGNSFNQNPTVNAENDKTAAIEAGRPRKACYPGLNNRSQCFSLVGLNKVKAESTLYNYKNPKSDSTFPGGGSFNPNQFIAPDRLLDLRLIAPSLPLSVHFIRNELMPNSSARGNFGVFSRAVLAKIEQIRNSTGRPMQITSGYRSPGHNSRLSGAASWSRHMYGDAIDFAISGLSYQEVQKICKAHGATFTQLYTDHIHCDWRAIALDNAFYPPSAIAANLLTVLQDPADAIAKNAKIHSHVSPHGNKTNKMILASEVYQEDDGQLLHQWQIQKPNGETILSAESTPEVERMRGKYKIQLTLGGSVIVRRELTVH